MFWNKQPQKSFEELNQIRNQSLTDSILVMIKVLESSKSNQTKDLADEKIQELINKIN